VITLSQQLPRVLRETPTTITAPPMLALRLQQLLDSLQIALRTQSHGVAILANLCKSGQVHFHTTNYGDKSGDTESGQVHFHPENAQVQLKVSFTLPNNHLDRYSKAYRHLTPAQLQLAWENTQ
jgi:hypothetical protein